MGLFFRSKRRNIRAWEYALFEGKNNYLALPNIALYEKLTKTQIDNDCRIIMFCDHIGYPFIPFTDLYSSG